MVRAQAAPAASISLSRRNDMALSTTFELADSLRETGLLSQGQIGKLTSELLPNLSEDPQELAYALVQRGWLTSYQAEQSLQGMTRQLVLGGYRLLEPLGAGGMGQVFKAWQKRLNRIVALKLIRPELMEQNPAAVRRFKREALAVAQLNHPNIVSIYDFDEADGTHFIVLEYVDGPDLERLVQENGPLPVSLACDFVRQAALGLQHAHEAGLVHRDIKPGNLLIARSATAPRSGATDAGAGWAQGLVKILDMGLARMESLFEAKSSLTREGAMMGTPDYCSPEQARDAGSADIRADLYSLGCTLYFLLSGRPPFPDGSMVEKLLKHQNDEPLPIEHLRPDTPPAVCAVVRQMMAKDPAQRPQLPIELAEKLAEVVGASNAEAESASYSRLPPTQMGAIIPLIPAETPLPAAQDTHDAVSVLPPLPPRPLSPSRTGTTTRPNADSAVPPPVQVVTAGSLKPRASDEEMLPSEDMIPPAQKSSVLRGHNGPVMGLAFSSDCKLLATGGVDATLHVWSLGKEPREVAVLQEPRLGDVHVVAFAPNGQYVISGSASINARMWRWNFRESVDRDRTPLEGPSFSDALTFSPDGQNLASAVGSSIWLWNCADVPPRKRTVMKNQTGDVKSLVFTPDNKHLISGDSGGMIQYWKLGWLGTRPGNTLAAHRAGISCLAFSRDGLLLASAGADRTVRIWDGNGAGPKEQSVLRGLKGTVRQMLFLPDEQLLLTVCDGGQIVLWQWAAGQREFEWKLEQPMICALALASDGSLLAAGSTDGTATLYDLVPD